MKLGQIHIHSLAELRAFAGEFAKSVRAKQVIGLTGQLGAGKTAFTKMLMSALGVKKTITSPTYILVRSYKGRMLDIHHLDLYRTKSFREIQALGVPDEWQKHKNVFIIEWADKIRKHLPAGTILLNFKVLKDNKRKITISKIKKGKKNETRRNLQTGN